MLPAHARLLDAVALGENAKLDGVGASRKGQSVGVDVVAMAIAWQISITVNDECSYVLSIRYSRDLINGNLFANIPFHPKN
jgi:hypothetical protein